MKGWALPTGRQQGAAHGAARREPTSAPSALKGAASPVGWSCPQYSLETMECCDQLDGPLRKRTVGH